MLLLKGIYIHVPVLCLFKQEEFVIETSKLHILMQCFQWLIIFTRPKVIFEQNVVVDLLDKY